MGFEAPQRRGLELTTDFTQGAKSHAC
jgi:hypothetical protein